MSHSSKPQAKFARGPIVSSRMRKMFSSGPHSSSPVPALETSSSEYKHTMVLLSPIKAAKERRSRDEAPQLKGLTATLLQSSTLRLDDFVGVSIINTSPIGSVKKVLHAPTLGMYAIRAVALSSREARIALVDWLKRWESLQDDVPTLVSIRATYWNQPEGYVSIVVEYVNSGSLQSLIDSVGAVPECILLALARQLCECLKTLHARGVVHGAVSPSHVLIERGKGCKLDIGVKAHLGTKVCVPSPFQCIGRSSETSKEDDIFDLGTTLLACAMGGTDWLDLLPSDAVMHCCAFHSILALGIAPMLRRLSPHFQAFLCACLKFSEKHRARAFELLDFNWFSMRAAPGIDISLTDLLGISFMWHLPNEYLNAAEKQLDRICETLKTVLMASAPVINSSSPVHELALDLGLSEARVLEKLSPVYHFAL